MIRQMRRIKQLLPQDEAIKVLERNTSGVFAVIGDDDYPYAVPVSYVYEDGKIYIHSGKEGHKVDAVKKSEKASFCVIDKDEVIPEEYTTYFRSVIAFGKPRIVESEEEKRYSIAVLGRKYHPTATQEYLEKYIEKEYAPLCMICLEIDHLTGKEAIELVRAREKEENR